jgi:ELWxxDGT repeat protein
MVADVAPGAGTNMVAVGSTVYFSPTNGVHYQLWKSDGTAGGTSLVADNALGLNPLLLTNVNGKVFFEGTNGVDEGLWTSDGTAAGTVQLTSGFDRATFLTDVNGTLFFGTQGLNDGGEGLWKSDGTVAGTVLLKEFNHPKPYNAYLTDGTDVNGTLFFAANDGVNGTELWKSDGTTAGTVMVKDINPGSTDSNPYDLTDVNGTLFFSASDSQGVNRELWKSDGTAAGTVMVSAAASNPVEMTNVNGTLFFSNNNQLWKSDGTAAGTVLVKDLGPFSPGSSAYNSYPHYLTNVNGTLFFAGDDGVHGTELWKSDGTTAGTVMVKDIFPGGSTGYYGGYYHNSSNPADLTNVNGILFFTANDGTHRTALWQTDGTAAGTGMVAGGGASGAGYLTNANGTLFFAANYQLWVLPPATSPTTAASLAASGFPATTTAGTAGSFTVTAENADGTTNVGYTGTVQFSTTDSRATIINPATGNPVPLQGFSYTFTAADAGVHTFSTTLKTAGLQSFTAADTATAGLTGTEGNITVNPAAASSMTVIGFSSTTTAGVAGNITVTLKDPYGNIAASYAGTVHFTSSDSKATLPANYTFTAADAGQHTFTATLKTAGTRSITAADTQSSALTATEGGITVNAAAASQLIISAPSTVTAGVPFSLTLTIEDAFGNIVTGYTGTVHFKSSDKTATLPANYTFTAADKGVHRFVGLVLRRRGNQTITITDTLNSQLTASVVENVM